MNKNAKLIFVLLGVTAALSVAFLLFGHKLPQHPVARITLDGELVQEIHLDQVEQPYSFTLKGPGGYTNTILVEPGRICVYQADCPDQVCVYQDFISDAAVPIVCLPNKLIIQIVGGGEDLDAATG